MQERKNELIWAFDPGEHTGWVVARMDGADLEVEVGRWGISYVRDVGEAFDLISTLYELTWCYPNVLVMEDFYLRPPSGNQRVNLKRSALSPVRVASWIEGIIYADQQGDELPMPLWFWQQPSDRKVIKDSVLKERGMWFVSSEGDHAKDAARHLLLYRRKELNRASAGGSVGRYEGGV